MCLLYFWTEIPEDEDVYLHIVLWMFFIIQSLDRDMKFIRLNQDLSQIAALGLILITTTKA